MPRMTIDELYRFLDEHFPQARAIGCRVEELGDDGEVRVRQAIDDRHLRPGGTVSGPTLMTLADTAIYYAVLIALGPVPLAVTTSLNINFLRRPKPADLVADASLLKLGRRLGVGQVTIRSDGHDAPVAHATVTYALPPDGAV